MVGVKRVALPGEEEAFPRGGNDGLTPLERRQIEHAAKAELDRDLLEGQASKNKRPRGTQQEQDGDDSSAALFAGKIVKHVELLKFKVSDIAAQLQDPASKVGEGLRRTLGNVIPTIPQLFYVGQFVRCVIRELVTAGGDADSKHKSITASLLLKHVCGGLSAEDVAAGMAMPACVRTVEDHGYTLIFGVKGLSGFLPKIDYATAYGDAVLLPGMLLDTLVKSVKKTGDKLVATVTSAPSEIVAALTQESSGLTLGALLPGTLVNMKVRSVLNDGLLATFLKYFHGTVDLYHLGQHLPGKEWQKAYSSGQKLKARILYLDPAAKRVGLSLLPHLLDMTLPPMGPMLGQMFDAAVVRRVDPTVGLLLELPMQPQPYGAYVHISEVSGERVEKLEKVYRPGQSVRARVIGFRPVDGLAVVSMRPGVLDQSILSTKDLSPGMVLEVSVAAVEDNGILVNLTSNIRGFVPLLHTSDVGSKKSSKKYKVGQRVQARVVDVDAAAKKVVLTLKHSLLESKLPVISSLADAAPGMKSHGWVTGVSDFGVFVSFYGGVSGLVHVSELGLPPGQKAEGSYQLGQVVRCRVVAVDVQKKRLRLSLTGKAKEGEEVEGDALGGLQPGDVVDGKVTQVSADRSVFTLRVRGSGSGPSVSARLEATHLSDSISAAATLKEHLRPGAQLDQLMVLERLENAKTLRLTRKASMVAAAASLPRSFSDLQETAMLPGFVASVTADAVYVHFLAGVAGRAGLSALVDSFVTEPGRHYVEGQSVRCQVVALDTEKKRCALTLKPSLTASTDATFLHTMLRDLELAEELHSTAGGEGTPVSWGSDFRVGHLANGTVHDLKEYGTVCDLDAHPDVVGLVTRPHAPTDLVVGQRISGAVLDVTKAEGIVDLSVKPELVKAAEAADSSKTAKKLAKLKVGTEVTAVVQLSKSGYLVASLPDHGHITAAIALQDFNQQLDTELHKQFVPGQSVAAVVSVPPCATTGGRLLLALKERPAAVPPGGKRGRAAAGLAGEAGASAEKRQKVADIPEGSVLDVVVTAVQPLHLEVKDAEHRVFGRIHITELVDAGEKLSSSPMGNYQPGQKLRAVVLGKKAQSKTLFLSARPAALAAAEAKQPIPSAVDEGAIKLGATVRGFVEGSSEDHVRFTLSPTSHGRASLHDLDLEPTELRQLAERLPPGHPVNVRVVKVDQGRYKLGLSLRDVGSGSTHGSCTELPEGTLALGKITVVGGWGVQVELGRRLRGVAALTELHDVLVPNALTGLKVGQYVRCRVMKAAVEAGGKLAVSLRPSQGGAVEGLKPALDGEDSPDYAGISELKEGEVVQGYVKHADKKGVFVVLGRGLEGRIRLKDLPAATSADPGASYPDGKLVRARIMRIQEGRIDLSAKTASSTGSGGWRTLAQLRVGEVLTGKVRRVEKFGVFVEVAGSSAVGLAHVSELSDSFVADPAKNFYVGQAVKARVLKVEVGEGKLSLTLKKSKLEEAEEDEGEGTGKDADMEEQEVDIDEEMAAAMDEDEDAAEGSEEESEEGGESEGGDEEDGAGSGPEASESEQESEEESEEEEGCDGDSDADSEEDGQRPAGTASDDEAGPSGRGALDLGGVGWGELKLDVDEAPKATAPSHGGEASKKPSKVAKKRAKEEKEEQIREAEAARIRGDDKPQSVPEFERLVMASRNSSFVWIQYMAFLISLGDADKARAVAERALQTINLTEQQERFNVWVAWLNLENAYGSPPEQAAMDLFKRALQHTDQKKLYMAMHGILQRSGRADSDDQLLKTMCKRFSGSAKVWLAAIEAVLKAGGGAAENDAPRKLLERAMQSLPKRKHIKVISRAALLEIRLGSAERGRAIFETIVRNYPRRLDLWSVYIDQEVKLGDQARIRALLERATHLQLPAKKMKLLFKRYLQYEKAHGTPATVEHVKRQAMAFVESKMG